MKKIAGVIIPFVLQHFLCCGALLLFLISSGYLLSLRQEANNKIFLIPLIMVVCLLLFIYYYYGSCCRRKGYKSIGDNVLLISIYFLFSFILSLMFMIYIFIPWWIPNYQGGLLLP